MHACIRNTAQGSHVMCFLMPPGLLGGAGFSWGKKQGAVNADTLAPRLPSGPGFDGPTAVHTTATPRCLFSGRRGV
jgi:hypothetical protein